MSQITKEIKAQVYKKSHFEAVVAKQHDTNSRFLKVTLCSGEEIISVPPTSSALLNVRRADGEARAFLGTVNADGTVTLPLTGWALELDDTISCSVSVFGGDGERLTSTSFTINVEAAEYTGDALPEEETADLLTQLMDAAENLNSKAQEVSAAADKALEAAQGAAIQASNASSAAGRAVSAAEESSSAAQTARQAANSADSAASAANFAATAASKAAQDAEAAAGSAETAANNAASAVQAANTAISDLNQAKSDAAAASANQLVNSARAEIDGLRRDLADTNTELSSTIRELAKQKHINSSQQLEIEKLKAAAEGNLYLFNSDYEAAYEKAMPADAMPYAMLDRIGGKTLVWNQLAGSGAVSVDTISGRRYCTVIDGAYSVITSTGQSVSAAGDKDMVFDLTAMFGAGNDPATPEEFRAVFPAEYYPHSEPTLMNFSSSEIVSRGKNLFDPSCFDGVEGITKSGEEYYGSIYSFYNQFGRNGGFLPIDCADTPSILAIKFDICVDAESTSEGIGLILGVRYTDGSSTHAINIPNSVNTPTSYSYTTNAAKKVKNLFFWYSASSVNVVHLSNIMITAGPTPEAYIPYRRTAYDTSAIVQKYFPDGMKSAGSVCDEIDFERMVAIKRVGGLAEDGLSYQQLEASIENQITDLFEETIEVEQGGALTFRNDHGEDFRVPIPNQETLMIKLPNGGTV